MEKIKCITFDKEAQNNIQQHIKDKMKADIEKVQNKDIPCEICERDIVRTAITYNGIKICHNCMIFFHTQAKLNNRTWEEEIDHQTKYRSNGG